MPKDTTPPDAAPAAAPLLSPEVMVAELSVGPVTAYRTARVKKIRPKDTTAPDAAPAAAPTLLNYEVMVPELSVGPVTAYRTARVRLTAADAAALNAAMPGALELRGI